MKYGKKEPETGIPVIFRDGSFYRQNFCRKSFPTEPEIPVDTLIALFTAKCKTKLHVRIKNNFYYVNILLHRLHNRHNP